MPPTDDVRYMRLAVAQARRGLGRTSPNPPVGAVVVARGTIVGRGYHRRAGLPHAEVEALRAAGPHARGGTLYVTLEPCAHHGRTPPCTEAIIASRIRRVVFGARDPNPAVPGDAAASLRAAGIEVAGGIAQHACDELIAAFRKAVLTGLPLVTLKLAASLDGRIATARGESRWITGERSRRLAHRLRAEHDAILVGAETILRDDPELTCRLRSGRNPVRVVLDGRLRVPLRAQVLTKTGPAATLVFTGQQAPAAKVRQIELCGAEVIRLPRTKAGLSMLQVLRLLGKRDIMSVLIEGGATVAAAAIAARVVDRLVIFYAPKLIGGDGRPMLAPLGVRRLAQAPRLGRLQVKRLAPDIVVTTELCTSDDVSSD